VTLFCGILRCLRGCQGEAQELRSSLLISQAKLVMLTLLVGCTTGQGCNYSEISIHEGHGSGMWPNVMNWKLYFSMAFVTSTELGKRCREKALWLQVKNDS